MNNIVKAIEKTLKATFNYDIMNYLMLMMVDKQVHYHVLPRYERLIDFAGISWKDVDWPGVPSLAGDEIDNNKLHEILDTIKGNLIL
ncbi:MAG: hypothetical protein PHI90_07385 [Clostridia bacterium]|nr:hypothetical protein [Clostridia bacterium]